MGKVKLMCMENVSVPSLQAGNRSESLGEGVISKEKLLNWP